jgi:type IV pilus assembly protein PilO
MRRNYSWRDPQTIVRAVLGLLLLANLVAGGLVLFPPGGSAEDLQRQFLNLQSQIKARTLALERTRQHAASVEKGRAEGDQFLGVYFLPTRTAFSIVLSDLEDAASQTKVKPREASYSLEPIEGSDTLSLMTITAAYEGVYADLLHFVHEIDRSQRMLIIESLNAAPQQGPGKLITVSMKLDTFVRDEGALDKVPLEKGPAQKNPSEKALPEKSLGQ